MLFKYRRTRCVITLEELLEYYKDEDYALEGTFEEWIEYEMETNDLIALEEVAVDDCLRNLRSEAVNIRTLLQEEVAENLINKIDGTFSIFQEKYKIESGDIWPEDSLLLDELIGKLADVVADVIIGEKGDEFALRMEELG